jgi:hypothetical protein
MIRFYIETLLTEKGISLNHTFEVQSDGVFGNHYIPMEVVIEFIDTLPTPTQEQIRKTLMNIDFKNGNILHYFEYLTKGMVELQLTEN